MDVLKTRNKTKESKNNWLYGAKVENTKEENRNWCKTSDHLNNMPIVSSYRSKNLINLNLLSHQPEINKKFHMVKIHVKQKINY